MKLSDFRLRLYPPPIDFITTRLALRYMSDMIIFPPSFLERSGTYTFIEPSTVWGYLPQLHEWAMKARVELGWEAERIGGKDHIPDFQAIPVCE